MLARRFQPRRNAEDRTNEKGGIARWEKENVGLKKKEEELLSEQLKKTKIEIYECWTHIVISIVTMLIAVVTAVLTWFK